VPRHAAVAWALSALLSALPWPAPGEQAGAPYDAHDLLRRHCGLNPDDLRRVAAGTAVSRSVDADSDAAAICAAIEMAVPSSFYLQRFRQIESFKRSEGVLQIGRFRPTPSADDLVGLTLTADDVDDLKTCRAGNCDFKLDAAGIAYLQAEVDFRATDARRQAEHALRRYLADYVARYLREGDAALMRYVDGDAPRSLHADLQGVLARSPYLSGTLQPVATAVGRFTGRMPDGADGFVYWSRERVGQRDVLSITHVFILTPAPGLTVMASKQIYASHYFHASLGLTMLAEASSAPPPRLTVIYLNRSRVDAFDGLLGAIRRPIARSRARGTSEDLLQRLARRLQEEYRQASR
jgi:hypothetical protein